MAKWLKGFFMADMKYSIKISALDAFTKPLQGMAKVVKSFGSKSEKALEQMADKATLNRASLQSMVKPLNDINTAMRKIGKNTGLSDGFSSLTKNLKTLAKISTAIGGAFTGLTLISQQATAHDALAKSVGLSGKSLSAWGGIVGKAGFDTEHVVDLVEEMNNKFGELESLGEMSSATDSLKMLGISFEDIKDLKPEEQFEKIMQAAALLDNPQIGASAVDMLLGGEANKLLGVLRAESEATGKSIKELLKEQERLNFSSDEGRKGNEKMAGESLKLFSALKSALFEIVGILGNTLAPLITKLTDWLVENFDDIREYVKKFANTLKTLFSGTDDEIDKVIASSSGLISIFLSLSKRIGAVRLIFGTLIAVLVGPLVMGIGLVSLSLIRLCKVLVGSLSSGIAKATFGFIKMGVTLGASLLSSIAKVTFAFIKMGIAFLVSPIGLWIIGIGLAVAGLVAIFYLFKDNILNALSILWQGMKNGFMACWDFIKKYNPFSIGADLIGSLWDGMKNVWEKISLWFQEKIADLMDFLPDWLKEKLGISVENDIKENSAVEYSSAITQNATNNMQGNIKVSFENAPDNMRVVETKSNGGVDLNTYMGYGYAGVY